MKKVEVRYQGWGENWLLGTLADNGRRILFEYSPEALAQQLELSPYRLKLRPEAYDDFPAHLDHLPGLIADSLPDGWGMVLMNRVFRKHNWDTQAVSPLARLGFIGHRSMGALTFEPEIPSEMVPTWLDLHQLANDSQIVLHDEDPSSLEQLAMLGGSPHGARPKALVHRDRLSGRISSHPSELTDPLLVKFQAKGEPKEVCAIEAVYAQLAERCGLEMPVSYYFDLGPDLAGFGVQRFDVESGMRVPVHTLAGLLHADFRQPQIDYRTFLRATKFLTKDVREVWKAFERTVFNVLFNNRDDHTKNFSYRLNKARQWELAPCYDLTFNIGPGGEHYMDVEGEARNIRRRDLLALAKNADLNEVDAGRIIDRMAIEVDALPQLLDNAPISKASVNQLSRQIQANRDRLK
ncbi:type II toxin-antitoxin system HipA family toxin [Pseudoduganella sp. DS3]|uniref:Type II toxin-antitoxin system HipA family toxin n=1 Tax=Pseudoduganella guangdongensis TaxID=2692179 RepID=A0A6N9HDX2_9BURK|nr:type II toxin-antitoxin system HipA family toxin [Pseudoduganella guangdongensis]MYN01065.1 type II toxin-antitoxin system HipA family toxin [Pseudoduganella guangdongensis]